MLNSAINFNHVQNVGLSCK